MAISLVFAGFLIGMSPTTEPTLARERLVWSSVARAMSRSAATAVLTETVAATFPEWDRRGNFIIQVSATQKRSFPRELMADYVRQNRKRTRVDLEKNSSVRTLESRAFSQMFAGGKDAGWATFRRQHPDIDQVVAVSRPGFSPDGRNALVYLETTRVGGFSVGRLAMLSRSAKVWRINWYADVVAE